MQDTLAQEIKQSQLMEEKYYVVRELMNYLHHAQFNREMLTAEMLKELKEKVEEMLETDF